MSNLTGRCNITVYIDIPADTELAAPLAENCIWRQVRGSGAEISGSDGPETATEKVKSTAIVGIVIFPNSLSANLVGKSLILYVDTHAIRLGSHSNGTTSWTT